MRGSYLKLGGLGVASSIALFTLCLSGCAGKGVNCPQVRLLRESGRSEAEIAASMQARAACCDSWWRWVSRAVRGGGGAGRGLPNADPVPAPPAFRPTDAPEARLLALVGIRGRPPVAVFIPALLLGLRTLALCVPGVFFFTYRLS